MIKTAVFSLPNYQEKTIRAWLSPDIPPINSISDDRVDWETFYPMMKDVTAGKFGNADDFVEGLKVFDKDNSSTVNCGEIRHVLSTLGLFALFLFSA